MFLFSKRTGWLAGTLALAVAGVTAALVASSPASAATVLQATNLRADYLVNPITVDDRNPSLSWELTTTAAGETQAAYQIQAATSAAKLDATPDLWDTGKVTSSASINVDYAGRALQSRDTVVWRVRVWGAKGGQSDWSPVARWEMGLLNASDWSATWIEAPASTVALPIFAKQFSVGKTVSRARLYLTGLGVYEARINGKTITKALLQPGQTDYRKRMIYTAYDVTSALAQGNNTIGVSVGNGIANVNQTTRYEKFTGTMSTPKLYGQLEVTFSDGTTQRVVTDTSWRTTPGGTTFSGWYGGEDYDASREPTGWQNPGTNLSSWKAVLQTSAPGTGTVLSGQMTPPIQQIGRVRPVKVTNPKAGHYVFDMGVNFSGWEQLTVSGKAGTKITMTPSELVRADGTALQNNGSPFFETYTLSGNGTEVWHPQFSYHVFRYLDVTGLPSAPTADTIIGLALMSAFDTAGTVDTGNSTINGTHKIIKQAINNNYYSVPTDCPNREKLGWLEQDHLVYPSVARNYDVAAYYRFLIRNMADAQYADGLVPDFVPQYTVYSGNWLDEPNWGSTFVISALQNYETYGDVRTLKTYYTDLAQYVTYLKGKSSGNLLNYGVGDWAAIDRSTPAGVTSSFGYYMAVQAMAKIAKAVGKTADVTTYSALATSIGNAFNSTYLNSAGYYAGGQQAADAMALDMGIVPANQRTAVLNHLVNSITNNGNHVSVGEIALGSLFRALQNNGRGDVVYTIATQTTMPSYGYMLSKGATALVEWWTDAGVKNSQSHFMLGQIDEWFSSGLGGIQADAGAVAYNKLVVAPVVPKALSQASATYKTPYGQAASSWTRSGSNITYTITIPVNTTATIRLPVNATSPTASQGQGFQRYSGGYAIYAIGSGTYTYTSVFAG